MQSEDGENIVQKNARLKRRLKVNGFSVITAVIRFGELQKILEGQQVRNFFAR